MASKKQQPTKAAPAAAEQPKAPTSRTAWILGWVVTPGVMLGGLFLGGVYVGANLEESWMTRAVTWLFG